jgi:molybdopterin molybdotransferase
MRWPAVDACEHEPVSTYGLDGVLPWQQARHVAASAARPLAGTDARLDEAAGSVLADPLTSIQDDPPADSAAYRGYAVCGEGPWLIDELEILTPGWSAPVASRLPVPRHTDAVLREHDATVRDRPDGRLEVMAHDPLTGIPDERVRPGLGEGIVRQGTITVAGHELLPAGSAVTPAVLALAAARGHDELVVVRPPVVGVLVLGAHLLDRGLPRHGRVRDALGHAVPAFVGALGARGNPAVRGPDSEELLLREIEDAAVDVLITTGSTAPGPDNHLRSVLRELNARWLVDGVSVTPGAQMLLARLPDGRFLIGLPGDPPAALAGLVTLAGPLIHALRGDREEGSRRSAVLMEDAPPADYADDTALVPVRLEVSAAATLARPLPASGPDALDGWAAADAIAVVPPGAGQRGDVVQVLDEHGRERWPWPGA